MLINIKMMHRYLFFVLVVFLSHDVCFGQEKVLLTVLKKDRVNNIYSFDSSTKENGYDKTFVKYLGTIITNQGEKYKVLSLSRIWGKNRHTSGVVYIYSYKNKFVGKYNLGSSSDLPKKVAKNHLYFTNRYKSDCDPKLSTEIDFTKMIPKEIFLKCKGSSGDIYTFSTEK